MVVTGGLSDGPVEIKEINKQEYDKLGIETLKEPIDENKQSNEPQFYLPTDGEEVDEGASLNDAAEFNKNKVEKL